MNVARHNEPGFAAKVAQLAGPSSLFDPEIEERARRIVLDVETRGDNALVEFTERFDGAKLRAEQLAISSAELLSASVRASDELRQTLAFAIENIESFSRRAVRQTWSCKNAQGALVGEKFDPFRRVGIYVPGGTAPLISTALMTIVLARVAGCPEIVVCTPCNSQGEVHPALLLAARMAGATEMYRIGGAQAVAALAVGTRTIARVDKLFGPGNAYVVAAKRLLFGRVAIDLLPGPSEILVLADDSSNPAFAAADLLAQAEHGSGHERVWLITTSAKLIAAVQREIKRQLPQLARRQFVERALDHGGWLIQTRTIDDAIALANRIAPEHCEIMMRNASAVVDRLLTSGAIFIGSWTPTVLGDYVAGPSHTLPTGGAGRSFAGLTMNQFQRRTNMVQYDRASLQKSLDAVRAFARLEGLDGHLKSAAIRVVSKSTSSARLSQMRAKFFAQTRGTKTAARKRSKP